MMRSQIQCSNLKTINFFYFSFTYIKPNFIFYNPFQECNKNFAVSDQHFTENTSGKQVDETGVGQEL